MKYIYALCLSLLFSTSWCQQAERTLVKSFNLEGQQEIQLDLDGPVEVRTWSENYLRVQMTVRLDNGSERRLKGLLAAGRYHLASEVDGVFNVFAPGLARPVPSSGAPLIEQFSFVLDVPEQVTVLPSQATLAENVEANDSPK